MYKEYYHENRADPFAPEATMFADDHHLSWILSSPSELPNALSQLWKFISFLRKFGLQVNPSKSQAVLMIKRWTYQVKVNGKLVTKLRLPGAPSSDHVVLVKQLEYLGITLNYTRIEEATMARRIGVAQGNFDRLRKILHSRRVLIFHQRLQLWQATVLPSLNYGILAVGVNKLSLEKYHGIIMRHIRSITNRPLHVTKISNADLLQSLGFSMPVDQLLQQANSRKEGIASRWSQAFDPMMHNDELWSQLSGISEDLLAHRYRYVSSSGVGLIPAEPEQAYSCEVCGKTFGAQATLRLHQSKAHTGKKKDRSIRLQDPDADGRQHGTGGMPKCRYCGAEFQRWAGLNRHISLNRCEKMPAEGEAASEPLPEPQPLVQKQEFLASFRRSGRQFLLRNIEQWEEARHHCSVCRQWLVRPADFKSHLKKSHQGLWQQYGIRVEKLVSPTTLNGTEEVAVGPAFLT